MYSNEDSYSIRQQSEDDLEDGELEDDEQEEEEIAVPVQEKLAESKENPPVVPVAPVVPAAIPSLLDLKISPPRNGKFPTNCMPLNFHNCTIQKG